MPVEPITVTIEVDTAALVNRLLKQSTLFGNCPFYGIPENPPKLPKGFTLIPNAKEFLRARKGEKQFYVFARKLVPIKRASRRDVRRSCGRLKLGQEYADLNKRHKIRINP